MFHTGPYSLCNLLFCLTFVSRFPGLRLLKVKQNAFLGDLGGFLEEEVHIDDEEFNFGFSVEVMLFNEGVCFRFYDDRSFGVVGDGG